MCGIVGIFLKNQALAPSLGRLLQGMLLEMADRGPDSAGFAVYRRPVPPGSVKLSLYATTSTVQWQQIGTDAEAAFGVPALIVHRDRHALLSLGAEASALSAWLASSYPEVSIIGIGSEIEVYKEVGHPASVAERFQLAGLDGGHGIGHTRMATESAVTVRHSHPFAAGLDICLVHNGSLSNHNDLRRRLARRGMSFQTDNDSEVAAAYLADRLGSGLSLREALVTAGTDLDGFFTFAVGTADGFAVARDAIACKPAVLAETEDWVAMASEYRAIATLPDVDDARVWEPKAGEVYCWSRA